MTKNFFGWIAYTLSRWETRRSGTQNAYGLTGVDQTHILTVIGELPLRQRLGVRRALPLRHRPPHHAALAGAADLYNADSNGYSVDVGRSNSGRLPDFNQLDLRVDKYFVFEKWTLDLYLDVQNV